MNKHAKSIWHAWLDEKEVQYYAQFGEYLPTYAWINADPSDPELFTPQECPHRWRIKPESKSRYYRVYLLKDTKEIGVIQVLNKDEKANAEDHYMSELKPFKWISRWVPYEQEVDQ